MDDRYVLAEAAEQDLEQILLHIAEDDLEVALRVSEEFPHLVRSTLADSPDGTYTC